MLMAGGLKDRETFQLTFSGSGPLGGVVAISDGEGGVRGYVTNGKVRREIERWGKRNDERVGEVGGARRWETIGNDGMCIEVRVNAINKREEGK